MTEQTPHRFSSDIDNDLDRSVQQEQQHSYKRDSSIGRFAFENQDQHHFNQMSNSNHMMGDSQFSQQGVFSFNDDYRMRQSMKSDQECELEDIGGNADMTDRNVGNAQIKNNLQQKQNNKQVKQENSKFSEIKIVERYEVNAQIESNIDGNNFNENEQNNENEGKKNIENEHVREKDNDSYENVQPNEFLITKQDVSAQQEVTINQRQQQSIIKQSSKDQAIEAISNPLQTDQLQQQSNHNKKLQLTPQKVQNQPHQKNKQQEILSPNKQWSNQSNKSYSPITDPDLYPPQSAITKNSTNQSVSAFRQQPQNLNQNLKQEPQKPKITLIKQSLIVEEKPTSSIRDWFRSSNTATKPVQQKQAKQYNPNPNQIPSPVKQSKQLDAKQKYRKQMEAEMQGFQKSLNQLQKNNINKSLQVNKQKQKANKTHLPPTATKNVFNNSFVQPASEDLRMLLKICVQKKKENYLMVRQWDKKRAQTMNLHRNVVEMLQTEIDKRIKSSLQNFQIYSNFFKQKLKQQEKFTTSPVINTKYALQNNSISKNIYINCSVILNSLSEENQAKCKKIQDFITLIKNDILKDLIDTHMHDSQRELLKVREKISTLKSSLKKYNGETEQKSQQLAKLFTQATVSVRPSSDFYSSQLQFLRSANQQVFIQKRLGESCLEYYHTALNQEFKRAKVIRQALLTYSKALKQTYNIELQQVGLQQLSKTQQIKLIEQFYSLDEMFDQRTSKMLKEKFSLPLHEDLSIVQVTKFIETFEYETFNNRMLLLKEFSAKYYAAVNKDFKTPREQNCHIVITVDFYLHLFFSPDKSSLKPDISLQINPKQLQIKPQRQQFIDIVKKQEKRPSMISYFWQSKNQRIYRVKFPSKDNKELFYDYLNKLLS